MSLNLDEVKKFIYETVFRNTDLRGGKEEIQTLPLWKTCIQHAVYTPYRKSFVLALGRQIEQEEASEGGGDVHKLQHFQRLVIFEAVVATGRVEILRNLILEQNTDGFVLADIQRIYDWIVGSKDSLVKSLEAAIIQILSSDILPYILRQQPYDQLSAANHINELKSFLHSVQILTQALFERKLHSLLDRFGSIERAVAFEKILNDTLLSQSVVELFFLHEEWCMLKTLWNVVSLVATHTSVGFVDINILRQEYHVWSEKRGADADLLPLFISECSLIFKDLLAALPGTLRYDICTRTNNSPVEILFEILFLPYRRLLAYKEEVMSSKVYVGRTLDDLTDQLVSHVQSARVVSLYYLLSSYYAQNISSEAMKPALSEAYGCSVNEVELVGILVDIDREVDKDGLAVQAVCQEDNMSYIKQSGWKVLPIIIKRLLVLGQQQHVQAMMVQLGACNHEYLHTPEGVVAYATSVTVPQWEMIWVRARTMCDSLSDLSLQLASRAEVTNFMCRWTIRHTLFSKFLQLYLHPVELDVVLVFLNHRAQRDIKAKQARSYAVDTLVSFLLQIHRIEQAEEIHQLHEQAVASQGISGDAMRTIKDRHVLIAACKKAEKGLSVNYEVLRHIHFDV